MEYYDTEMVTKSGSDTYAPIITTQHCNGPGFCLHNSLYRSICLLALNFTTIIFGYTSLIKNKMILLLLLTMTAFLNAYEMPNCPDKDISTCSCYKFEDDLFIECPGVTSEYFTRILQRINGPVQSFSVYEFDQNATVFTKSIIPQGVCIRHFHISHSSLRDIDDDAFIQTKSCLETLSIVSSNLTFIPQKAFNVLHKLISLDLGYNKITEIADYSFLGLPVIKLSLKGNQLYSIAEAAFSGIEDTLSEIDLSENNLKDFPLIAISQLRLLSSLRLAWNDIDAIQSHDFINAISIVLLDLSCNNFVTITEDSFTVFSSIKTLSLHFNLIEHINPLAFYSLKNLESLDLSHNRIKSISRDIFGQNKLIKNLDLSHNHIHHINGLFRELVYIMEINLSNNNILKVPSDAFSNCLSLEIVNLEDNNIKSIHEHSLNMVNNLTNIYLGYNMISEVPEKTFKNKKKLKILRLDNNLISTLKTETFTDLLALKEIHLENNCLKHISKVLFSNCKSLQEIHLQINNISKVETGAFESLPNLQYVNLQRNLIKNLNTILPYSQSLVSLHLDDNKISIVELRTFARQTSLTKLWLGYNSLSVVDNNLLNNFSSVEILHLNNNKISIIHDFCFDTMTSAKYLDLRHNKIYSITNSSFSGLKNLEDLYLSTNNISNIMPKSFDMLKKLRNLDLSNNFLKIIHNELFKEGLPLRTLSLQNCSIKIIEEEAFRGLNNLNFLTLERNLLRSEDISRLSVPGLKTLKLSFNNLSQLQSFAFRNLPLLQTLDLDNCRISYLPPDIFLNNEKLVRINLSQNFLQDLELNLFSSNNIISEINLSKNMLNDVPYESIGNLSNIEIINFSDNSITTLNLSRLFFLDKLKQLYFNNNKLSVISNTNSLSFSNVVALSLHTNSINILPENLLDIFPKLKILDVSKNIIQYLFFISKDNTKKELVTLDISYNLLEHWKKSPEIQDIFSVLELNLSNSNLSAVTTEVFHYLTELRHLYMNNNNIKELEESPFKRLGVLETIDLSDNFISSINTPNFYGLSKLVSLNLSLNSIIRLSTFSSDLKHLKILDLSFNKIEVISQADFMHLIDLTELNLRNNRLQVISERAFEQQKKMKIINLSFNIMETLSSKVIASIERQIHKILLEGNPLSCGCESRDLWIWMTDHTRKSVLSNARCERPYFLYGKLLGSVDMPELCELPAITEIQVHRKGGNSMSVMWQVRSDIAIRAFQIIYYSEGNGIDVQSELVDNKTHLVEISGLKLSTDYAVCVLVIYQKESLSWNSSITIPVVFSSNSTSNNAIESSISLLGESPSSECTTFTLTNNVKGQKIVKKSYKLSKVLTRRLGLIVGCSMGVVTFILLVSILGYSKNKKRKLIPNPDQIGSELNYRNSLQNSEDILLRSSPSVGFSTDNILLGLNKKKPSIST